jgi:hypothetical protein
MTVPFVYCDEIPETIQSSRRQRLIAVVGEKIFQLRSPWLRVGLGSLSRFNPFGRFKL